LYELSLFYNNQLNNI